MIGESWQALCEQFAAEASPGEMDHTIDRIPTLDEDERAALWLYAWCQRQRGHQHDPRGARRPLR